VTSEELVIHLALAVDSVPDVPIDEPVEAPRESAPVPGYAIRDRWSIGLACSGCGSRGAQLELGPVEGTLGLFAELRAFWCGRCEKLVSVPRLSAAKDRSRALETLGGIGAPALKALVPLSIAFELAELTAPPKCPSCSRTLRNTDATYSIEEAIDRLRGGASAEPLRLETIPCPSCKGELWSLAHATCVPQGA
jgi:hypothetical protein